MIALFLIFFSTLALADDAVPRHQFSFGGNLGVGWTASSTAANKTALGIDDYKGEINNFTINYAYRMTARWQAGLAVGTVSDEQDIALEGGDLETEVRQTHVFIFATYNFHDQLPKAFYLTAMAGRQHFEIATNDKRDSVDVETDIEYDLTTYGLVFGKRFLLRQWKDEIAISYSPNIGYFYSDGGGDYANDGLKKLQTMRVDIIRFDIML